ncbi:MAG: T9SS type A sorting domain-containing protein [Ignavibacteria bacterium]|nr:T9SS type A sorting domain-containing protein [Ignavibacteria bacterium]
MRKLILFLLLTLLINEGYSQNGWYGQSIPLVLIDDIQFINSQTGFACGPYGRYAKTTNGGDSWTSYNIGDTTIRLTGINFINENTGWMGGSKLNGFPIWPYRFFMYYTTNGGTNWVTRDQSDGTTTSVKIEMLNKDSIVFAYTGFGDFSSEGSLTSTFNGGSTYNWGMTPSGPQYYSIQFLNQITGFVIACYDSDTGPQRNWIFKTTNSGANWNAIYKDSIQPPRLISAYFVNENTGFFSSQNGKFGSTTNGGVNWTTRNLPGPINSFHFFNENTGYAGTNYNSVDQTGLKRTTDGGATWINMTNSVLGSIGKIFFINNLTGWAIGSGNGFKLMKTITGGLTSVTPIGNSIPDNFSLSQNYPNPFNPSTVVSYQLPVAGNVSIKVYDALGNEIETLVNEKQNAGSYSVDFNAASLPSGIYFYKLVTEKFSETKKMILIK